MKIEYDVYSKLLVQEILLKSFWIICVYVRIKRNYGGQWKGLFIFLVLEDSGLVMSEILFIVNGNYNWLMIFVSVLVKSQMNFVVILKKNIYLGILEVVFLFVNVNFVNRLSVEIMDI